VRLHPRPRRPAVGVPAGEALVALGPACEAAWRQGRSFQKIARVFVPVE
jgi:hypothetical protein